MTQDLTYRTARVMIAFQKAGEVQRQRVEHLLGLTQPKYEDKDAGRPYRPVLHTAEESHD